LAPRIDPWQVFSPEEIKHLDRYWESQQVALWTGIRARNPNAPERLVSDLYGARRQPFLFFLEEATANPKFIEEFRQALKARERVQRQADDQLPPGVKAEVEIQHDAGGAKPGSSAKPSENRDASPEEEAAAASPQPPARDGPAGRPPASPARDMTPPRPSGAPVGLDLHQNGPGPGAGWESPAKPHTGRFQPDAGPDWAYAQTLHNANLIWDRAHHGPKADGNIVASTRKLRDLGFEEVPWWMPNHTSAAPKLLPDEAAHFLRALPRRDFQALASTVGLATETGRLRERDRKEA